MIEKVVEVIKDELGRQGVQPSQLILFGSHARGNARPDSDWDIFVVVPQDIEVRETHRLIIAIKRRLAQLRIPNDILIKSESQFNAIKDFPGNIAFDVYREGVLL